MGQGRRTVSAEDSVTVQCMGGVALSCAKPRLPWVPRLVVCPCMGTAPRVAKVGGRCGDGHSANACKGGNPMCSGLYTARARVAGKPGSKK